MKKFACVIILLNLLCLSSCRAEDNSSQLVEAIHSFDIEELEETSFAEEYDPTVLTPEQQSELEARYAVEEESGPFLVCQLSLEKDLDLDGEDEMIRIEGEKAYPLQGALTTLRIYIDDTLVETYHYKKRPLFSDEDELYINIIDINRSDDSQEFAVSVLSDVERKGFAKSNAKLPVVAIFRWDGSYLHVLGEITGSIDSEDPYGQITMDGKGTITVPEAAYIMHTFTYRVNYSIDSNDKWGRLIRNNQDIYDYTVTKERTVEESFDAYEYRDINSPKIPIAPDVKIILDKTDGLNWIHFYDEQGRSGWIRGESEGTVDDPAYPYKLFLYSGDRGINYIDGLYDYLDYSPALIPLDELPPQTAEERAADAERAKNPPNVP